MNLIRGFLSYLSERQQRVVIDRFTSSYGGLQHHLYSLYKIHVHHFVSVFYCDHQINVIYSPERENHL